MLAVKLAETPIFQGLLSSETESLKAYQDDIWVEKVEVYAKEQQGDVYLSASCFLPQEDRASFDDLLQKAFGGQVRLNLIWRRRNEKNLEFLQREEWPQVVADIWEKLPSLRSWLTPETPVMVEDENCLRFFVPNAAALEYFKARQEAIAAFFLDQYGLEVRLVWEIQEQMSVEALCDDPVEEENEEEKYVEEILARQKKQRKKGDSRIILGRECRGEAARIRDLTEEENNVICTGYILQTEVRQLRSGRKLLTFGISDKSGSLPGKIFIDEDKGDVTLNKDAWYKMRGDLKFDRYTTELTFMPRDIITAVAPIRRDEAPVKRVELHLHTKMSEMDGVSSAQELVARAAFWGHEAVAITDHGVVQAFPEAAEAGEKHGVKVILGMEGYLANGAPEDCVSNKVRTNHIILLAKNGQGLKNLYKLVSLAHLKYFYRRPRLPRQILEEHREGLLLGSACEAGELYQAVQCGEKRERLREIASFYDYLEIQPLGNNRFMIQKGEVAGEEKLKEHNRLIVTLGEELNIPVVATCDVHFMESEDEVYRRILMAGKGFEDADNQAPLYFRNTEEMLAEFAYLGEATAYRVVVENPRQVAAQIEKMKPFPDGFFEPKIPGAPDLITQMTWEKAHALYGDPLPSEVDKVLRKELASIIGNGFAVLYYIAHLLVKRSNDDGYLVGSRGSVGSSFVATMTGITEVNPLPPHYRCLSGDCLYSEFITDGSVGAGVDLPDKKCPRCGLDLHKDGHDIPFETFLGFKGDKVPDIDLNFSGEYQPRAHKYTEEIFGKENVFRAGTITTVAEKTAYGFAKNYFDDAGKKINQTELDRMVLGCTGVKRSTGQHPGGLMVIPKECDVYDFTPLQRPANDTKSDITTTHFDYHSISGRLVKLDILGHDDPTVIKFLEDLTGVDAKKIPLDDAKTMSLFSQTEALGVTPGEIGSQTGTLGIPEFGTKFVRQMLEDTKPSTFSHLVRISGLSHGTNVWLGNAQDLVREGTADISTIIACRDDIMIYLIQKGLEFSQAFRIMEDVRKGKGVKESDAQEMKKHDVPQWYIDSCRKISYMFPKAHAVAYVTMAFRIAWFKVYHPEAFYAAFFTVRADEFDADIVTGGLPACKEEMERIDRLGKEATAKDKNLHAILELAVEMYCRGVKMRKVDLWESHATKFLLTGQGLLPPFSSLQGMGGTAAHNLAEFRDRGGIHSVEDLQSKGRLSKTVVEALQNHGCLKGLPERNQLSFF